MTVVKHVDLVRLKFCNRGARQFFERHGIDWAEFMKNGLDSSVAGNIDDAMMEQVVAQAIRREQEGK